MKLPKVVPLLVATLVMSSTVSAQVVAPLSASKAVNVSATLASACVFATSDAVTLNASYPAFAATAVAPEATVSVQCTRGVGTPVVKFGGTAGPVIDVVNGLVFQLTAAWTAGTTGTVPDGSSLTAIGSADSGTFLVKATFPAGQAGTTGLAAAVNKTMTIQY